VRAEQRGAAARASEGKQQHEDEQRQGRDDKTGYDKVSRLDGELFVRMWMFTPHFLNG
jgi:hypothetical protein